MIIMGSIEVHSINSIVNANLKDSSIGLTLDLLLNDHHGIDQGVFHCKCKS